MGAALLLLLAMILWHLLCPPKRGAAADRCGWLLCYGAREPTDTSLLSEPSATPSLPTDTEGKHAIANAGDGAPACVPAGHVTMHCTIPEGLRPNEPLLWEAPSGQVVSIRVPQPPQHGKQLSFQVPCHRAGHKPTYALAHACAREQ